MVRFGVVRVGYPLAVGRVVRAQVILVVVGKREGLSPGYLYLADLGVFIFCALGCVGYLLAVGGVVGVVVVRTVLGDVEPPSPPTGVDGEDLPVGSGEARISDPVAAGRPRGAKVRLIVSRESEGVPTCCHYRADLQIVSVGARVGYLRAVG